MDIVTTIMIMIGLSSYAEISYVNQRISECTKMEVYVKSYDMCININELEMK